MDAKVQKIENESDLSPAAKDPTYGERWYDFIFNKLSNFWGNLLISAGFTYYVLHSNKPLAILGNKLPSAFHEGFVDYLKGTSALKLIPNEHARAETARVMGDGLLLTTAGNLFVLPSVWLGAKIKEPFVKWLDKGHYGEEACENDPRLVQRHLLLQCEPRPTLFGTLVGRVGAMGAVQLAAYTLGHEQNFVNGTIANSLNSKFLRSVPGVDKVSGGMGAGLGSGLQSVIPNTSAKLDRFMARNGIGWSKKQLELEPSLAGMAYNQTLPNFSKYLFLDTLYTAITTYSIHPIISAVRQYVPFMSYRDVPFMTYRPKEKRVYVTPDGAQHDRMPEMERSAAADHERDADTPHPHVSDVRERKPLIKTPPVREMAAPL
jgi:hypothetical protein